MSTVSIIWWRDIPTQIMAGKGRRAIKHQLDERFVVAVDRAAMVGGATDTDEYLKEWRKSSIELDEDDIGKAVEKLAEEMEAAYPGSRLAELARNGGREKTGAGDDDAAGAAAGAAASAASGAFASRLPGAASSSVPPSPSIPEKTIKTQQGSRAKDQS